MSAIDRMKLQAAMDRKLAALGGPDPKPSFSIPWNDDRAQTPERMWKDGHSAGEIAAHLRGVSRNAVIAKLERMGLVGKGTVRAEPSAPAIAASRSLDSSGQVKGRPRQGKTRQQASKPVVKKEQKPCRIAAVPPGFAASLPEHREPARPDIRAAMAELDCQGHSIMELTRDQCRWPVNDAPRGGTHLFCGASAAENKSYCAKHAALAGDGFGRSPKGGAA